MRLFQVVHDVQESPLQQLTELVNGKACLTDEGAEEARFEFTVVGDGQGLQTAGFHHNDVAATSAFHLKPCAFEDRHGLSA